MQRSKRRKAFSPACSANESATVTSAGGRCRDRVFAAPIEPGGVDRDLLRVSCSRIPHESPTHMRVAFFLVLPNNLLPSSPKSRNISKSSRPPTKGTSVTMAAAYDRSPAFVLFRVAGSRTPAPDGSRGSRDKARGGKHSCRHAWSFRKS